MLYFIEKYRIVHWIVYLNRYLEFKIYIWHDKIFFGKILLKFKYFEEPTTKSHILKILWEKMSPIFGAWKKDIQNRCQRCLVLNVLFSGVISDENIDFLRWSPHYPRLLKISPVSSLRAIFFPLFQPGSQKTGAMNQATLNFHDKKHTNTHPRVSFRRKNKLWK